MTDGPVMFHNDCGLFCGLELLVLFCKRGMIKISQKKFFALVFQFVLQSITVCAILVEGIMWNISVKLFLINLGQWLMRRYCLKIFLFLALVATFQQSGTA